MKTTFASALARQQILQRLRSAMPAQVLPEPDLEPYRRGPLGRGSGLGKLEPRIDPLTLVPAFESAARSWRAEVHRAAMPDWPARVADLLAARGCRRVATGAALAALQPAMPAVELQVFQAGSPDWKARLFDQTDAGIGWADAGLADTGTLLLRPGPDQPRSISLVPPVYVALLRVSSLHASLPAAIEALQPQANLPTNLLLVTGPSKTSDIQQTLAYGAHGPKELLIVLVDDISNLQGPQP